MTKQIFVIVRHILIQVNDTDNHSNANLSRNFAITFERSIILLYTSVIFFPDRMVCYSFGPSPWFSVNCLFAKVVATSALERKIMEWSQLKMVIMLSLGCLYSSVLFLFHVLQS